MNTIRTRKAFNERTQKARISAGWAHDSSHFHFARQHDSRAPFVEPASANRAADAVVGVACVIGAVILFFVVGI